MLRGMTATIRFRVLASVVLLLFGVGLPACDKHAEQKKAIREVYDTYNQTAESGDGPGQAAVLSANTLTHYDKLLKIGLNGKADEVMALSPSAQHEILAMRNRATRKQLQGYTGKGYVIHAVKQGWWSGFGDDEWKLRSIKVNGDSAEARIVEDIPTYTISQSYRSSLRSSARIERNRKPREYPIRFVCEDGKWKVDETTLFPRFDAEATAAAKAYRVSMRDFLMAWEEDESGKEVTMKIWDPMK